MSRSIKVVTNNGQSFFTTPKETKRLLRSGLAEIFSKKPLVLKLKNGGYCPEYYEELRHQRGRQVDVTKCPSPDDRDPDQDWEGKFEFPGQPATGRKSIRCKPPRQRIPQVEREYQRYKTGWLRRRGEEQAERVDKRMRAGARALSKVSQ